MLSVVNISHSSGGNSIITFLNTLIQKATTRLQAPALIERRREVQELFSRVWGTSEPKLEALRLSGEVWGGRQALFPCNNPWLPSKGSPLPFSIG